MICLAIAIGALGFAAMRSAHRRCHGHHGCGDGWPGPFGYGYEGDRGPHGFRGHRQRRMLHALLWRLDASPAQERAILGEVDKLRERLHGVKAGLHDVRGDLAAALRGPALDDAALGAVLGKLDAAEVEARSAAISALREVHEVLDDRQRGRLADLLERGGGGGWWRTGPYR